MVLFIVITTYLSIFIFDYLKIRKTQSKKQNIIYLSLLIISFLLLIAYILDLPVPILSKLIRLIIKKSID